MGKLRNMSFCWGTPKKMAAWKTDKDGRMILKWISSV
jgi:hypothetical protein